MAGPVWVVVGAGEAAGPRPVPPPVLAAVSEGRWGWVSAGRAALRSVAQTPSPRGRAGPSAARSGPGGARAGSRPPAKHAAGPRRGRSAPGAAVSHGGRPGPRGADDAAGQWPRRGTGAMRNPAPAIRRGVCCCLSTWPFVSREPRSVRDSAPTTAHATLRPRVWCVPW